MSFVSYEFLALALIVFLLYYRSGLRVQNVVLLLASLVFYGWWDYRFLALMIGSSAVDFALAKAADPQRHPDQPQKRKRAVALAVFWNMSSLGFFKYFGFFTQSLSAACASFGLDVPLPVLEIILPVGISFYSFQTMSYTIDVYRGELPSTTSFFDFLLYVSFFPQLVAGPIERGASLLPQILSPRSPTLAGIRSGAELAMVGYLKKMVIADNLKPIVDRAFASPNPDGFEVLIGVYAFAFRIYGDFSGYTDIARGVARMLGFELTFNFRLPYFAISPADFWRRWHVSLSTWLRDYLYVPMGGNRRGWLRTYRNLSVTMLLGGLWHGAMWKYVIWGAYHGLLLVIFRALADLRGARAPGAEPADTRKYGWGYWLAAFGFFQFTCLGWLIFEARSAHHAWVMVQAIASAHSIDRLWTMLSVSTQVGALALPVGGALLLLLGPLLLFQVAQHYRGEMELWTRWPNAIRVPAFLALYYVIVCLGASATYEFVYFQF